MPKPVACKCPNCGAAISVQPVSGVTKCAYCQGAIQVTPDEKGGVALSVKHINIQGGSVQIADNLTVVHGDTAVTCAFCGKHNLNHNTFHCRACDIDDLCAKHQTSSGICDRCEAEAVRQENAQWEWERATTRQRRQDVAKRRSKRRWTLLASVLGAILLFCVVVPLLVYLIAQIPIYVYVILVAVILGLGVIAVTVRYFQNERRREVEHLGQEEGDREETQDAKDERVKRADWWKSRPGG